MRHVGSTYFFAFATFAADSISSIVSLRGEIVLLQVTASGTPLSPLSRALGRGLLGLSDTPRAKYRSRKCFHGSLTLQGLRVCKRPGPEQSSGTRRQGPPARSTASSYW